MAQAQQGTQTPGASVLIVGASFAGLSAAYFMHRLGYAVTLVEIAPALKKGGTPVNIKDGVVDVVKRMGLFERIAANGLPRRGDSFFDATGEPIDRAWVWDTEEDAGEEYEVERDLLLQMLYDAVRDDVECLFSESVTQIEQGADDVRVTLRSGAQRTFSLVLGCDGTHSAVRRMCFGAEAEYVRFMKIYFSLTIVDQTLIAEDTQQMFNAPGRTIMLNAYNGKTDIAFCFAAEEPIAYDRRDRQQQRQMIVERFEGLGWRVPELLQEMQRCEDFYFDQVCQVHMPAWSKGRVVLVGDAAYCPSPAAGMGGSTAIMGAAAMADALSRHRDDLPAAFAEYDASFRPTIEAIQAGAMEHGAKLLMPD